MTCSNAEMKLSGKNFIKWVGRSSSYKCDTLSHFHYDLPEALVVVESSLVL